VSDRKSQWMPTVFADMQAAVAASLEDRKRTSKDMVDDVQRRI
jgi:hypothetical protein